MMATPHLVAGAAIGKAVRQPWLALPLALVSHQVLDMVPHLDAHGMFGIRGAGAQPAEVAFAALDVLLGVTLVVWATASQPGRARMWWAAVFALLPDIIDNVPLWQSWFRATRLGGAFTAFHHTWQANVPPAQWPLGLGTQIVLVMVLVLFLRAAPRGSAPARDA
jgi:hypothetical protein